MSERSQRYLVWWGLISTVVYGVALGALCRMVPPPSATLSAPEIAQWYVDRATSIRIGATICSYTGAFMLPLWAVLTIQIARQERGKPIWAVVAAISGAMMSLFLVFPPLCFGIAAFTPNRAADVTALMHEIGLLTFVTTDQYYVFCWVAVIVICLSTQRSPHSPFPRWFGYFSLFATIMFEAGGIAFNTRVGPFAWDGLLVFWSPFFLFTFWIGIQSYLLLKAIKAQESDPDEDRVPLVSADPVNA